MVPSPAWSTKHTFLPTSVSIDSQIPTVAWCAFPTSMERVPNLLQKKENKPTESLPFVSIRVARLGNFQETLRQAIESTRDSKWTLTAIEKNEKQGKAVRFKVTSMDLKQATPIRPSYAYRVRAGSETITLRETIEQDRICPTFPYQSLARTFEPCSLILAGLLWEFTLESVHN